MRPVLSRLLELLQLERIEDRLFRGTSQDLGWGAVFGGQVLGQALSAAVQTVPPERQVHSMHGYFLRQGDVDRPVVYDVDCTRDGRSFTTRRVVAIQHGRAIFHCSVSFQVAEEGFSHQADAPDAPDPEGLPDETARWRELEDRLPAQLLARATAERPIDIRPVDQVDPLEPGIKPPSRLVWYRVPDTLPDDPRLHQYLLAYASDFHFLTTAMQPHGVTWLNRKMQVASLDHAMWFHRPVRMDQWLLHEVTSPNAHGARGLVLGRFYDQQGRLVASTAQEGLMRDRGERRRPV